MSAALTIDVISDVVCPWCYIGKRLLEQAIALKPEIPVEVRFRPYFLNPWVPREGISREEYLITKFGSVERYNSNNNRVVEAAAAAGLTYNRDLIKRQPNTLDCHRLILWAGQAGKAPRMKQRLMELYFSEGGDLTDRRGAGRRRDRLRPRRRRRCGRCWRAEQDVDTVEREAQSAKEAGIDGVPCFILGGMIARLGRAVARLPRRRHRARRERAGQAGGGGVASVYRANRTAIARNALAAVHEPSTRTPIRCQSRVMRAAPATTRASAIVAPSPVPISMSTASCSEITSGGESSPIEAPIATASGPSSRSGSRNAAATSTPQSAPPASSTELAGVSPTASASAMRPAASAAANSICGSTRWPRGCCPISRPSPSSARAWVGVSSGCSNPPARPPSPSIACAEA